MHNQSYIKFIADSINSAIEQVDSILLYGENINVGSCISGLARGLKVNQSSKILNVGNCELTHIGLGMGIMADGGHCVLFVKQLDFLLLGLDQMVNTFNYFRAFSNINKGGSFTIISLVCDHGFQGPQSSLNVASDISSLCNINTFCLNGRVDISNIIHNQIVRPGFRLICASQRLLGGDLIDSPAQIVSSDNSIYKYHSGNDITVICFNFSLLHGINLVKYLGTLSYVSDLFHINYIPKVDLTHILESCSRTQKLVLIDDSKSVVKFSDMILSTLQASSNFASISLLRDISTDKDYGVGKDEFTPDFEKVKYFIENLN